MTLAARFPTVCLALVVVTACDTADAPAPATRVDSAGIEIVTSTDSSWTATTRWTVSAEPILTIGDDPNAADPYQLVAVGDAMRRSDGSLVVVNSGTREVRIFAANGEHLRSLGGPGEGPEEYGYPMGLRFGPDTGFTVLDRSDAVRYDFDGEFLERETFDRAAWAEVMQPIGQSEGALPLPNGLMLAPVYGEGFFGGGPPSAGPPYRPDVTVVRVDPSSGEADTLAHIGGILQQFVDVGAERPMSVVPPFAPSGRFFVARDGSVAIYDGAEPEVHHVLPYGVHRIVRWTSEPEPITAAEIEASLDEQRNASWTQSRLPQLERAWAVMEMPAHKPRVTLAHSSLDGSLWVRTGAWGEERVEWRVFDADGLWLGSVELPGTFNPTEIGHDYVLGVRTDLATEVQTVEAYAVEKP